MGHEIICLVRRIQILYAILIGGNEIRVVRNFDRRPMMAAGCFQVPDFILVCYGYSETFTRTLRADNVSKQLNSFPGCFHPLDNNAGNGVLRDPGFFDVGIDFQDFVAVCNRFCRAQSYPVVVADHLFHGFIMGIPVGQSQIPQGNFFKRITKII